MRIVASIGFACTLSLMQACREGPLAAALPFGEAPFDWRSAGLMTTVKNQGEAGTCWAFAALGLLETILKRDQGLELDLAEQHLINCVPQAGPFAALDYLQRTGVLLEQEVPYLGMDGDVSQPDFTLPHLPHYGVGSYRTVSLHSQSQTERIRLVQDLVRRQGPLLVSMTLFEDLDRYRGGVYRYDGHSPLVAGHILLIVGWNYESDGRLYWIVKNSWGSGWGDRGYGGIGLDEAGIATEYGIYIESGWVR